MYKIATAVAIIALLGVSVYGELTFSGNVSMKGKAKDWQYRRTTMGWALGTGWFTSADVHRAGNVFTGDLIVGGIKGGLGSYPSTYLAYYTANLTVGVLNENIFSLDAAGTSNFVGNAYLYVVEKDSTGAEVTVLDLRPALLTNNIKYDLTKTKTDGSLKYGTFVATKDSYSISFTVIVSDVTGVVSLAGAVVTPKVLETIIEIDNWPYKASTNTLTLVTVAATGSGSADRNVLLSGTGTNQVYFQLNNSVVVNGAKHSVTINSSAVTTDDLKDSQLIMLINNKFRGSASVHIYNATFPAGAASITYDPTLGSGDTVESQQGSATATTASFFLVAFFAIVAALL